MVAEDLSQDWYAEAPKSKKRGAQVIYSDFAIEQFMKIRCLFGLKMRQTEGFINYIFEISNLKIKSPSYSIVYKRCKKLDLSTDLIKSDEEFEYVSMDSTGIQTYTGNEWLENKHGKQYIRRIWKKLHIAVDKNGRILVCITTSHHADDRSQIENLLKPLRTKEFLGDPGYDGEEIYQFLIKQGIKPTIRPPNHKNKIKFHYDKTEREEAVDYQQSKGYQVWRVKNKYGRRERVENTFYRFKTSFGSKLLSRDENNMANELIIKCKLLNRMIEVGMPISVCAS
jgi:hypothetical protein